MSEWPGPSGQELPPDRPIFYPDPAAAQPATWPGFQEPAPVQPGPQYQPTQPPTQLPTQPDQFQQLRANDALMPNEPILVTIGDISVTSTTVYTPSGSRPLSEVTWAFADMSVTSQAIPTWAIICAIVFFVFCFVGLLFLLAKEEKTQGVVQVTVQGPGFLHTSTIPVSSLAQVADINARVNYARTLTLPGIGYPAQPGLTGQVPGGQMPGGQVPGGQAFGGPQGITGQPGFRGQPGFPGQPGQQDPQPGQFS